MLREADHECITQTVKKREKSKSKLENQKLNYNLYANKIIRQNFWSDVLNVWSLFLILDFVLKTKQTTMSEAGHSHSDTTNQAVQMAGGYKRKASQDGRSLNTNEINDNKKSTGTSSNKIGPQSTAQESYKQRKPYKPRYKIRKPANEDMFKINTIMFKLNKNVA